MTGLELAREFYAQCRPLLYERMPQVMELACAGLCGEGSECFGCDDQTSRDHDFGATFCLWLPRETLARHQDLIGAVFADLPRSFRGMPTDFAAHAAGRRGPRSIEDYYFFFTGLGHAPAGWREWLPIPEFQLAAAVNGEVFEDNAGIFSQWRAALLAFYPEDLRLKKLAARCMQMAQSGQYNLPRCLARGEGAAAMLAAARFAEAAISFVHLINKRYMPFYKWAPRLGGKLPVLGRQLGQTLDSLARTSFCGGGDIVQKVEDFCSDCAGWLRANGLSDEKDSWLWAHGPQIISRVQTPELREMDLLAD